MKRILDPEFRYTPSYDTNVRATFERARRERDQRREASPEERSEKPLRLVKMLAGARRVP